MCRRADGADLAQLIPLVRAFYEIDRHPFDRDRVTGALVPLLADDTFGQVWVVERDDHLVGYAVVTWSYSLESGGPDCLLDEIYVTSPSSGLGTSLLSAAIEGARSHGAATMYLETESHNERGRDFYLRNRFELDDSIWMSRDLTALA